MIIIKQFENKNILVVDTASLKAKLGIKNLGYFATEAGLPGTATNGDYAIVGSTDSVWVWDSDTNAWKNTKVTSTGDMLKSVYDTDNDGKVDAAETADTVEWSGVQNKPTTFTPTAHNHNYLYYTESEIDTALGLKQNTLTAGTGITIDNTNPLNPVINSSSGVANFTDLSDVPVSYVGQCNKILGVNATEDGVEFISLPGGGDMFKSENLSGLSNYATARINLGLNTTANQTDYTNKRFMSDAQQIKLDGISGTNTGDNATNSQYSGLATSKQDTLVSGTNIKRVNGTSLLGSGNIVISGGSGATKRILTVGGTIGTTGTNVGPDLTIDGTYTISQINMWYGTAGNGTLTVDINKNGTTLFATTKPSITSTNKYSINTGTLTTTSLASGDSITIDIDAVLGTPGTDLYVEIIYS